MRYSFMRIRSPRREWILTVTIWRLQIRIGSWQRAIWWRRGFNDFAEIYNSWGRNRHAD